jgi:Ca-activated chloride channel family protein
MQRLWLTGRVLPAGARLMVQHVFRSGEDKPLEVIYSFPLPRDAALRAFRITGEGFEAHSELRQTEEAVKAYEQGIADGSLSALARQYGDGVVNLTVGNIRPNETVTVYLEVLAGVELRDDGFRFRFPFTLAPAYHPRMKAAVVAEGEGEMELPPSEFGDMILPRFREDAASLHEVGFDLSILHQLPIEEIGSPSHSIRVRQDGVALAPEKDVPNRDLVLDVRFKEAAAQVFAGPAGEGKRAFAAIVPSTLFGVTTEAARRTVIVLDRSGSMQGAPIAQARKAIEACLAALSESDWFGLVAFDDQVESMSAGLLPGTRENREKARAFLSQVDARGGTELARGFLEAARMLAGGGDVLILTDGQVAGTEQILTQARNAKIRLSCLGIGSASQDRFLALLARETAGVSRFVTARERVDLAAVDLFASIGRPVASGLKASGNVQPEPPSVVFAGTPVLLFGETEEGPSAVELTWDGGRLALPLPSGDSETGQTLRLLQGSRLITDWESRYLSEDALAPLEKRKQSRVGARLLALSQAYGLASREMSLVAVVKRAGDRAGELPETRVVPVGMPQDVSFGAYFGAPPAGASMAACVMPAMAAPPSAAPAGKRFALGAAFQGMLSRVRAPREAEAELSVDPLMDLASELEPDGGMPGESDSARAARSVAAVLAFVAEGHTLTAGAFRSHVARLVKFLKSAGGVSDRERALIDRAIEAASSGSAPRGDWLALARAPGAKWARIEEALKTGGR